MQVNAVTAVWLLLVEDLHAFRGLAILICACRRIGQHFSVFGNHLPRCGDHFACPLVRIFRPIEVDGLEDFVGQVCADESLSSADILRVCGF
jgi:hypothetical protein